MRFGIGEAGDLDPHLLVAYKISRLAQRPATAMFATSLSEEELRRWFAPWKWLEVSRSGGYTGEGSGCAVTLLPGNLTMDSSFPTDQFDKDLLAEIAHHDFEIGGKNEWDGAPTRYGANVLRLLSRTHCRTNFPPVVPQLLALKETVGRPLEALDIGCGPLSWLRWGSLEGMLRVSGIDPLIECYEVILARHGLLSLEGILPHIRIASTAESVGGSADFESRYEFIYTNNALDHVQDIMRAIDAVWWALAPGGFAYLQVATREGTRQSWDQLHQHDVYLENGYVLASRKDGSTQKLCGPGCRLEVQEVLTYTPDGLTVLASKA